LVITAPIQIPIAPAIIAGWRVPAELPPRMPIRADVDASPHRGLKNPGQNAWAERIARRDTTVIRRSTEEPERGFRRQTRPPALTSAGYAPFLAQQAAQTAANDIDAPSPKAQLARGASAYLMATGDPSTLLGPVRPTDIRI
jgi:hypothetical protein